METRSMAEWIQVETALPESAGFMGNPVLVYSEYHDLVEIGEFRRDHWHVWLTHGLPFGEVSHWAALPGPPS